MSYEGPHPFPVKSGGSGSASLTGILTGNGTSPFTASAVSQYTVLVGGASNLVSSVGPGSAGQVLQSGGAGSNPAYSTATFPSTASSAGTILRSDGTNWVATTSTYPNTNAVSTLLYASSANVMAALATANNGLLVTSNTGVPSILAGPGTTGKILQSNAAAAPSFSTATYPSTATGTGTILRADGTNWVATTATYPATTSVSEILYSSSANVIAGLTTANNSVVLTNATGVPSLGTSLINDFTYTSSTAGATRTLTVTNTDNTNAASTALITAVTGGASAGDAYYKASTTTTVWSFGVDNSVTSPTADPFVISQGTALGTNNIMSVATSGEINYPLQPAFLAYLPSTDNNKTGNGTVFTIGSATTLTEVFDQNSDFNTNGTFTAPVTGRYCLIGGCYVVGTTIAQVFTYTLGASNRSQTTFVNRAASALAQYLHSEALMDMDAGDTCVTTITITGEAGDTDDIYGDGQLSTYFSGYLAC